MIGSQLHNGVPYNPSVPKKVWRKVRKTIIVDSRDRQMNPGSHAGAYTVTLPAVYQNVYAVNLKSIEIPISFYAFSAAANNTTINVTYNNGIPTNVTIPDGNYSSSTLATALNSAFNTAFGTGNLVATYSTTTSKMTFTGLARFSLNLTPTVPVSANGGNSLTSNFTTWWGLGYFLGFTGTTYSSASSSPYVVTGVFAVNPFPTTYILMDIETLNKIDETSLDDRKSWRVNGAFAKIPMNGNSGTVIFTVPDTGYNPINRTVYNPPISKLTNLVIKFRLHDGRIIDFNGVEHSFTLELELLDNNFDEFSSLEFSV
jgi:hypothetical protein